MSLHCLHATNLRRSLLLSTLLLAGSFSTYAADEILRKAVGKNAFEMAYSQQQNALWVATAQSRTLDKGGIVYRLDPTTLAVTQIIHNDLKPYGATINNTTQTLWFSNTTNYAVTAIDAKTGNVIGHLILDNRKRSETVHPLAPRELVVNEKTNTIYIAGISGSGEKSVIWVVDGETLTLKNTIADVGIIATGLAIDAEAKRLYVTNFDGELLTIDSEHNQVISRKKLQDDGKEHFYLNLSLDTVNHRAFVTDSQQPEVLVISLNDGKILHKIAVPESLAVLFNPQRNEIYVTHRQAGEVSVIDGKTYKVSKTFKTPEHPNSLALSAEGNILYVTVKQESPIEQEATQPDDVVRIAL